MEIPFLFAFAGLILYLKLRARYADLRTRAEKESHQLQAGIDLFNRGDLAPALAYFNEAIRTQVGLSVAYRYRARCYQELGDDQAALDDLNRAKAYDDTQPMLHLEIGQLHFQVREYEMAFSDFDKAIFYSQGKLSEAYRWRGLVREKLGQSQLAWQDLQRASRLNQAHQTHESARSTAQGPFWDRRLGLCTVLTGLNSIALLLLIKQCSVVHGPYLLAASSAVLMGVVQPQKGWVLALLQVVWLSVGYFFFTAAPQTNAEWELEQFNLYGSIGLTMVGSYGGSVLINEYRMAQ